MIAGRPDAEMRDINDLELRIYSLDDDADGLRWDQAGRVAKLLACGMSTRTLARQWINVRTGRPYNHTHAWFVAEVFSRLNSQSPRPRFLDEYNKLSNSSRYGTGDDEWFTREALIEAARTVLGGIDLDPASCKVANTVVKANRYFSLQNDGLTQAWFGRVWLNPPYSHAKITPFAEKIVHHVGNGSVAAAVVLVNSTTETRWFATLHNHANAVCFPTGRQKFWKADRTIRTPSVYGSAIFYFGAEPGTFRQVFAQFVRQSDSAMREEAAP